MNHRSRSYYDSIERPIKIDYCDVPGVMSHKILTTKIWMLEGHFGRASQLQQTVLARASGKEVKLQKQRHHHNSFGRSLLSAWNYCTQRERDCIMLSTMGTCHLVISNIVMTYMLRSVWLVMKGGLVVGRGEKGHHTMQAVE